MPRARHVCTSKPAVRPSRQIEFKEALASATDPCRLGLCLEIRLFVIVCCAFWDAL